MIRSDIVCALGLLLHLWLFSGFVTLSGLRLAVWCFFWLLILIFLAILVVTVLRLIRIILSIFVFLFR